MIDSSYVQIYDERKGHDDVEEEAHSSDKFKKKETGDFATRVEQMH